MTRHDPHDTLFKEMFSRPAQAAALLRHALPRTVSRRIRWGQLELQDSSVLGPHGELRADLMYRAPAPPEPSPFFLLEHKSGPDAATCYQLSRYVNAIWDRHEIRRSRRVVALPAVFAVVVVHGRHGGRRGRTLADLIAWAWPASGCMPSLPIFVLDLTRMRSSSLRDLPMPALTRVTLFCLAIARRSRDVLAELHPWIPELRALQANDDGVRGLESVLRYVMQVANVPYADLKTFVDFEVGPIAKEALMTTASQLTKEVRKKAMAEGLAKGKAEGKAEGLAEGQARILLKLLAVRFGPLSSSVERRVRRANAAERERWAGRLLGARTLEEVLRHD